MPNVIFCLDSDQDVFQSKSKNVDDHVTPNMDKATRKSTSDQTVSTPVVYQPRDNTNPKPVPARKG